MKKVSVIMGVYNEKISWVKETINSILEQTYKNIELIVILDNPENQELKIFLDSYKDKIKFEVNDKNLGLVKTLNRAIDLANGEYIARIDADDIAIKNRIETQVMFLEENKEYAMVGSEVIYIDEEGNDLGKEDRRESNSEIIKKIMKYRNEFVHPSILIKKSILIEVGRYKEADFAEDYELFLNLIANGYKVSNINEKLLKYRVRGSGISQSKRSQQIHTTTYLNKRYAEYLKSGKYEFDYVDFKKSQQADKNKKNDIILSKIDNAEGKYRVFLILYLMLVSKKYFTWFTNKIKIKFV